ncbi:ABC transporter substrate-binding protein [Nocardioides sp. NPDC051685]|uniref:ABC transporter substrate-binding protein n=1 Tax=Nocardioides sp. NPDC051685 TaxID=3364334 RepID=UPI0037A6F1B8
MALAGCGGSDSGSNTTGSSNAFTIYASLGLSGPLAAPAAANVAALKAAAEVVNKDGGIDGRMVRIVTKDDGLDPAKATTLLQEQLDKGSIDLVVAGSTSNVGLALISALTREGIVSSGQQATLNDGEKYPYHFGMVVPNKTQVQALVDEIVKSGAKKVAMLHSNDANGQAVAEAYASALDTAGATMADAAYAPNDVDMTAQLQALESEDPDVLVLQGLGPVAGYALKSRTKLGWNIPTYGHADFGSIDLSQVSGPSDWDNVKILAYYPLPEDAPRSAGYQQMLDTLSAAGTKIDQPISQYAVMWDLVFLAKAAWESSESDDAEDLKAAWLELEEKGGSDSPYVFMPSYRFQTSHHQFDIDPADAMTVVSPRPIVNGLITSSK